MLDAAPAFPSPRTSIRQHDLAVATFERGERSLTLRWLILQARLAHIEHIRAALDYHEARGEVNMIALRQRSLARLRHRLAGAERRYEAITSGVAPAKPARAHAALAKAEGM